MGAKPRKKREPLPEWDGQPFDITEGRDYVYRGLFPHWAYRRLYRVVGFCRAVPSYQRQVIVLGLEGSDQGKLFCCTLDNFAANYAPLTVLPQGKDQAEAERPADPPPPEKVVRYGEGQWHHLPDLGTDLPGLT